MTLKAFQKYAAELKRNGHGWGLFMNAGSDELFPGAVGFFDDDGHWYIISEMPNVEVNGAARTEFNGPISAQDTTIKTVIAEGGGNGPYVLISSHASWVLLMFPKRCRCQRQI